MTRSKPSRKLRTSLGNQIGGEIQTYCREAILRKSDTAQHRRKQKRDGHNQDSSVERRHHRFRVHCKQHWLNVKSLNFKGIVLGPDRSVSLPWRQKISDSGGYALACG